MTLATAVEKIVGFVDLSIIPVIFMLAFLAMLVGIFRYFFLPGEENLQKGRQFLLWGGIAFVLMFSIWGVVALLLDALTLD